MRLLVCCAAHLWLLPGCTCSCIDKRTMRWTLLFFLLFVCTSHEQLLVFEKRTAVTATVVTTLRATLPRRRVWVSAAVKPPTAGAAAATHRRRLVSRAAAVMPPTAAAAAAVDMLPWRRASGAAAVKSVTSAAAAVTDQQRRVHGAAEVTPRTAAAAAVTHSRRRVQATAAVIPRRSTPSRRQQRRHRRRWPPSPNAAAVPVTAVGQGEGADPAGSRDLMAAWLTRAGRECTVGRARSPRVRT